MGQLGLPEMIVIGVIALLVFGPKKLPELGSGLGKAIRDFKRAMNETTASVQEEIEKSNKPKPEEKKEHDQPTATSRL